MFDFNQQQFVAFNTEELEYVQSYIAEVIDFGEDYHVDTVVLVDNDFDFDSVCEDIEMLLEFKNIYIRNQELKNKQYIYDGICLSVIKKENIFLSDIQDNQNTLFYKCSMNIDALKGKNLGGKFTFINNKLTTDSVPNIKTYIEQ